MELVEGFVVSFSLLLVVTYSSTVKVLPFFITEPSSATVSEGQNVTLTCEVGPRGGAVEVRWTFNGTELGVLPSRKGLTVEGSNLRITSSTSDTSQRIGHLVGVYQCIARNRIGAVISRPITLALARIQSLSENLSHQLITATEGSSLILPCRIATKNICSSVQMQLNASLLKLSARHKLLPSKNLRIENVSGPDSGTYTCLCWSHAASRQPLSSTVLLRVPKVPSKEGVSQFVWTSPQNTQVIEGETLTLECAAVGWPPPLITWLRYGGVLPATRHSQQFGVLTIRDVRKTDEGTYICRAENTSGPPQIHVVFVDVLLPPEIVNAPDDSEISQGGRVNFSCRSKGYPKPTVTWYHNAVPVVSNTVTKIAADGTLVITEAAENQSGIYQCIVINAVNSTSASARLIVRPHRPSTVSHRDDDGVVYRKGSRFSSTNPLRRTLMTSPIPPENPTQTQLGNNPSESVGDLEEDVLFSTDLKSQLMQSDDGRKHPRRKSKGTRTYRKQQHRKTGQKQNGVSLVPPSKPATRLASDTSVELKWVIGQSDGLNVTLFKVQFKEMKSQKHRKSAGWYTIDEDILPDVREYTVTDLKPGSVYQFRVVAIYSNNDNKHGPNSDRVIMSISGHPKTPLTAPTIVAVIPLSSNEISMLWQFIPAKREVTSGFMIHYKPYETNLGYKQYIVDGSDEREVILSDLQKDTTYSLRMRSFNSEGFSDYSNTAVKKTMGPSDNVTDSYPLNNYTPLFPPDIDDNSATFQDVSDADVFPVRGTTMRSGVESQIPLSRASYSQQNKDLLFVVLGVVLGAVFVIVVFIIVFCFWRQRQQQLLIAALQAGVKTNNSHNPLRANSLATAAAGGLKNYDEQTIRGVDPRHRKRPGSQKDHIPSYHGNGCPANVGGFRAANALPSNACCHRQQQQQHQQQQPKNEDWNVLQRLSVSKSARVCNHLPGRSVARGPSVAEGSDFANTNYESRSDTSDGDSLSSTCVHPWLLPDRGDIYNSDPLEVSSHRRSQHLPSSIICQRPKSNCSCDRFSCHRLLVEPSTASLPKLAKCCEAGNNSLSGQSDSLQGSCSLHGSSSSPACDHRCCREQPNVIETNDSGVYDEHVSETTSVCKRDLTPDCVAGDDRQTLA